MLNCMKSIITVAVGIVFVLSCAGCSQHDYTPTKHIAGDQEYGYIVTETTGITRYAVSKGKKVAIKFRSDSDSQAVNSLQSLGADVVYGKADGKQMVLIGKLHTKILWTLKSLPNASIQYAESQPYQEFTLRGWRVND